MHRSAGLFTIACLTAFPFAFGQEPKDLPKPAEARAMTFAPVREKTLANGLRVVAIERHGLPIVTTGLLVKAGAESDPSDRSGLTSFVAGLLPRGTQTRSATQVAQDLEVLGAALQTRAEWDATTAFLTSLAPNTEAALGILADVVCHPAFATEEIERFRKERTDEVQVELEQPSNLARTVAPPLVLGPSPYAHRQNGTPSSLAKITRDEIVSQHAKVFRPDGAALILAGDLTADAAFAMAEKAFGAWEKAADAEPTKAEKVAPPEPSVTLVDMPDAGQAAVYVGCSQQPHAEDTFAVSQVANTILGGGYSSRLNREVRIKRGLSYGCGSKLYAWRAAGVFGAACQTKNESAAEVVKVIRTEIEHLGSEAVPEAEFTARRLVLSGAFQRDLETNEGYVKRVGEFIIHGEPVDAFAAVLGRINAVTPADVQKFATTQLSGDRLTVVVVGKASLCEKPLKEAFPNLRVIPQAELQL